MWLALSSVSIKYADISIASSFPRVYNVYITGIFGTMRKEKWLNYTLQALKIHFLALTLLFLSKIFHRGGFL